MKKNTCLRLALLLFVCTWASSTLMSDTLAKYVTSGIGTGSARVASFSFEMGSYKPATAGTINASGGITSVAKGPWPSGGTMTWDEIVVNPKTGTGTATFEFPMFDYEYTNSHVLGSGHTVGPNVTVKSSNNDMVIAPGTGFYWYTQPNQNGIPNNNPNSFRDPDRSWYCLQFRNNSEVRVRFEVAIDPRPVTTSFPNLKLYYGSYPDYGMPLTGTSPIAIPGLSRELGPNETYTGTDLYFNWAWLFDDGQDGADTALGEAGTGIVNIPLIITVTQID